MNLDLHTTSVEMAQPLAPLCVAPNTTVREVFQLMRDAGRGAVFVCRDEELIGIFTERDALKLMAEGADLSISIEDVMIPSPVTVSPTDSLGKAISRMSYGGYRRLPVLDQRGRPVGEIDVSQIVHYLVQHFPADVYNSPPSPHRVVDVSVEINLPTVDSRADLFLIEQVQATVADIMDEYGFELAPEHEPTTSTGSWWGIFLFRTKDPVTDNELERHFSNLRNDLADAAVFDTHSAAVERLLGQIHQLDEVVLRLGNVIVAKCTIRGTSRLLVETLSSELERDLKRNPKLLRNPRALFRYFDDDRNDDDGIEQADDTAEDSSRSQAVEAAEREYKYDAFISYRRLPPDNEFALSLLRQLEKRGYVIAIDVRDFSPNASFLSEMERCVKESRFTLAIISPRYLQSGNCEEESVICKALDMHDRKRRMAPISIEKVQLPVWLYDLVGVDFTDDSELNDPMEKLARMLGDPDGNLPSNHTLDRSRQSGGNQAEN